MKKLVGEWKFPQLKNLLPVTWPGLLSCQGVVASVYIVLVAEFICMLVKWDSRGLA